MIKTCEIIIFDQSTVLTCSFRKAFFSQSSLFLNSHFHQLGCVCFLTFYCSDFFRGTLHSLASIWKIWLSIIHIGSTTYFCNETKESHKPARIFLLLDWLINLLLLNSTFSTLYQNATTPTLSFNFYHICCSFGLTARTTSPSSK